MPLYRLMFYAAIASGLWVTIFLGAGYWFGSYDWVRDYLAVGLAVIVAASALPGLIVYVVHRARGRRAGRG
jgi:membrane protein DedA with SNARE-associated domain